MNPVKPYNGKIEKYIWHVSWPKNRQSIFKNGLLPQEFKDSRWSRSPDMYYPPAIFVNNNNSYDHWFYLDEAIWIPQSVYDQDFWRIDTRNLNNKWFYDLNFTSDGSTLYTTDPIPPENLRLYRANNIGCSECNTLIDGLSLNDAFKPYKGRNKNTCERVHTYCYNEKLKSEFNFEELAALNGRNTIKNLPYNLKEEIKPLLIYEF